jgi:4'-phosphopantetheinyl transferase
MHRLEFNVSQTHGLVACAVSRELRVGIDVERTDRTRDDDALYDRCLSATERADLVRRDPVERDRRFTELWTLKEATLKARGDGLTVEPSTLSFELGPDGTVAMSPNPDQLVHAVFEPTPHHRMTVAVEPCSTNPVRVRARQASDRRALSPIRSTYIDL